MKIWVDDTTHPPDDTWIWTKSVYRTIVLMTICDRAKEPVEISLSHDIGSGTVRPLVEWWCEKGFWPYKAYVHEAKPEDRFWLETTISRHLNSRRSRFRLNLIG